MDYTVTLLTRHTTSASTRFLRFSSTLLLVYVELFRLATWGTVEIISSNRCILDAIATDHTHMYLAVFVRGRRKATWILASLMMERSTSSPA